MNETNERMLQLIDELNRASDAYYNGLSELMTDYEWDAKFDELQRLEKETGVVLPNSPTQKVSEDNIAGGREAHEFPALSLAKTKQVDDIVKWAEGRPIWISWKLDGLTLVATYDNGRLSRLVTRGNGHIGTNITRLQSAISGLPATIDYRGHLVVRGEAVISYDDFQRYLAESGEDYANPRNLASGTMTLLDISEVKRRRVRWIPFTLVYVDDSAVDTASLSTPLTSWGGRMQWLEQLRLQPVERRRIDNPTAENIEEVINLFTREVTSNVNPYPVDGLVVTYDDTVYAETGSVTGHHATRAGLAFKWQDEAATTLLDHIEWSCAANSISPVAVFDPVELEGTTVKRASLCNISECERLGIGGKGSRIEVIKANKIIPKVIRVQEKVGSFTIPTACPVCHHTAEVVESDNSKTKTLHCVNEKCPAKELKKFARFVSKEGMDIDGLSEQTLQQMVNQGWVSNYLDIYHLGDYSQEMMRLAGFGERSVQNLLSAIEKSRQTEAHRLLYALSIPLCGVEVCRLFLGEYALKELIERAHAADDYGLFSHINGIGQEKSSALIGWMHNEENYQMLLQLMTELNVEEQEKQSADGLCRELTFVITGTTNHFANRNELKTYIEREGGKVVGSVSNNTNYLINNDVESTSSKNKRAKELGVEIISEDDFIAKFMRKGEETAANPAQSAENNPTEYIQTELF